MVNSFDELDLTVLFDPPDDEAGDESNTPHDEPALPTLIEIKARCRSIIGDAVDRGRADAGAIFEPDVLEALGDLQMASTPDYKRFLGSIRRDLRIPVRDVEKAIREQRAERLRAMSSVEDGSACGDRRRVLLEGDLQQQSRAIVDALDATNVPPTIFTMRGNVVCVRTDPNGAFVEPLNKTRMRAVIGERLECFVEEADSENRPLPKTISPSRDLAENVSALSSYPFPPLDALIRSPFIGRDGEAYLSTGYVKQHHVFVDVGDRCYETLGNPTRDDADAATSLIDEMLGEFAFADEASRANAFAMAITLLLRPAIRGSVPLFAIDAARQGTGKTTLALAIAAATSPIECAVHSSPRNDDEWRKTISAILANAVPLAIIDNVKDQLASGALAAVLTSGRWQDRRLGSNDKLISARCTTVWCATGNALTYDSDLARRVALIQLAAPRSSFSKPLLSWTRDCHQRLAAALMTMAAFGMHAADLPTMRGTLPSFEDWSELLGRILCACGIRGFLGNLSKVRERDDEEAAWSDLADCWFARFGTAPIVVRRLLEHFRTDAPDALAVIFSDADGRGAGTTHRFTTKLRARLGVAGRWLLREADADLHHKSVRFRLLEQAPPAPLPQFNGAQDLRNNSRIENTVNADAGNADNRGQSHTKEDLSFDKGLFDD